MEDLFYVLMLINILAVVFFIGAVLEKIMNCKLFRGKSDE